MSNLSISDVVHASVKDKGEQINDNDSPDEKQYLKNKFFLNDQSLIKLNLSQNIIYNETNDFDKTAVAPFYTKPGHKKSQDSP